MRNILFTSTKISTFTSGISTTSDSIETSAFSSPKSSTTYGNSTVSTTGQTDSSRKSFIYPLVGSICGLVCLVIVVCVIVCLKKRWIQDTTQPRAQNGSKGRLYEKSIYMSGDHGVAIHSNRPQTEHEYNYIDKFDADNRASYYEIPSCEADNKHRIQATLDDDYDYSSCLTIDRDKTDVGNNDMIAAHTNKGIVQKQKLIARDSMYDNLEKSQATLIIGVNDYHHLNPGTLKREEVLEAYHTIERGGKRQSECSESGDEPGYHIANVR
ncbi:uncharacterized protein LOC132743638 [Ruditapes philippinarum]|uniref:uncharacterized protein LOC132743638 n=1 Tax=Ruditapes philippinarum TaxID=129788 RepID=UPI00295BB189|nr:uncharacterized protein LOC132743638 [Ruditapes philippinarum]